MFYGDLRNVIELNEYVYMWIYMYMCMCLYICVCMCVYDLENYLVYSEY